MVARSWGGCRQQAVGADAGSSTDRGGGHQLEPGETAEVRAEVGKGKVAAMASGGRNPSAAVGADVGDRGMRTQRRRMWWGNGYVKFQPYTSAYFRYSLRQELPCVLCLVKVKLFKF
jgi:hypothetical protein